MSKIVWRRRWKRDDFSDARRGNAKIFNTCMNIIKNIHDKNIHDLYYLLPFKLNYPSIHNIMTNAQTLFETKYITIFYVINSKIKFFYYRSWIEKSTTFVLAAKNNGTSLYWSGHVTYFLEESNISVHLIFKKALKILWNFFKQQRNIAKKVSICLVTRRKFNFFIKMLFCG